MAFSLKNLIAEIEKDGKTVVGWLVKAYAAFHKNEPSLIQVIDNTVSYAQEALVIVLGISGQSAIAAPVNAIISEAVSDLNRAAALVYDFGPSPTAAGIFAAVQSNLATIESVGHISDPVTVAKLKLIINAVGTVAQLIAKAVAAAQGAAAAPAAA